MRLMEDGDSCRQGLGLRAIKWPQKTHAVQRGVRGRGKTKGEGGGMPYRGSLEEDIPRPSLRKTGCLESMTQSIEGSRVGAVVVSGSCCRPPFLTLFLYQSLPFSDPESSWRGEVNLKQLRIGEDPQHHILNNIQVTFRLKKKKQNNSESQKIVQPDTSKILVERARPSCSEEKENADAVV